MPKTARQYKRRRAIYQRQRWQIFIVNYCCNSRFLWIEFVVLIVVNDRTCVCECLWVWDSVNVL